MTGVWINVGCGTHYAPKPWINLDTHTTAECTPDIIVAAGDPLPYDDNSCERVYLGHVLEHVPWCDVPAFLAEIRRVLDGDLMVVGPDTIRTLDRWKVDQEPWHIVTGVLEHPGSDVVAGRSWPDGGHYWNCDEQRVIAALDWAGFTDIQPISIWDPGPGWPVTNPSDWQLAVAAR